MTITDIETKYKSRYDTWKDMDVSFDDNRKTYCFFYEQVADGIRELQNCSTILVHVGFYNAAKPYIEFMDRIIQEGIS